MIIDVSHASDGTFRDIMAIAKGTVIASHSNCREIAKHPRNLTDEMIWQLADAGGIAGLNLYGPFLGREKESRIEDMTAHILHMLNKGGSDFPAIGTDFDGFGLKSLNMDLGDGTLPKTGTGHLELIFGNGVITDFYETGSGNGYYDTGKVPNINLMKDSLFMITDTENYNSDSSTAFGDSTDGTAGAGSQSDSGTGQTKPVQKYVVRASGVINGGLDDYSNNYDSVFCDLETLKQLLRKEYAGKVIPGQPKTKAGKALKGFYYTSLKVKADDIDHVNEVADVIRNMGYNVETNAEYLDSMKSQFAIVQAVLGGIGAVSLLVAAIGIANTMMMSIYERTKEIGVMKVLGCSLRNIREMFLLEAAFIGLLGGIAGNILSFVMSAAINIIVGSSGAMSMGTDSTISYIPWWLVLMSMVFAVLVGVLAGYFPAKRAMKLSPLAAIRNE